MLRKEWLPDARDRDIPLSTAFKLRQLLSSDAEIQGWVEDGLPSDKHSIQNGMLATRALRFPLCIDPQQQAVSWIKSKEKANKLVVRTFRDGDFMKQLELAVQFGYPFLFEDCETVSELVDVCSICAPREVVGYCL